MISVTFPLTEKSACFSSPPSFIVCITVFLLQEKKVGFREITILSGSYPADKGKVGLTLNKTVISKPSFEE